MPGDTFESFTSRSGEPIFRFLTGASFEQRQFSDIPYECCVFKIDHVTEVMVVSRYGNKDEWHANCGERAIIKELLRRAADTKVEKITPPNIARDEIAGAVARGWCHPKNKSKEMDVDLAEAIVDEVLRQLSPIA